MRGRKPGPKRLQVLEGGPGNRAEKNRPRPRRKLIAPDPPAFLDKVARDRWRALAPELAEKGLLTTFDLDPFAAYCVAYSDWAHYRRDLQKLKDRVVKTPNGGQQQHPLIGMANRAQLVMERRGEQFGMGNLTRQRMDLPESDDDEDDNLLSRGRKSS